VVKRVPWIEESWRSVDELNHPSMVRDEDCLNACRGKRRASSRFILPQYAIPSRRCPESAGIGPIKGTGAVAENEGVAPGIGDAVSSIAPGAGADMAASKAATYREGAMI